MGSRWAMVRANPLLMGVNNGGEGVGLRGCVDASEF
jgi:hypothetical protein